MTVPAEVTQPCERCGEWGCEPRFHSEAGSELAMVATTGALLGGTLLGLLALPGWLRRFERVDAPPGHPRERLRQDRVATALVSVGAMATLTLSALVVAGVQAWNEGPRTAWMGPTQSEPLTGDEVDEVDEILMLIEHGSPTEAAIGMEQLVELAPTLSATEVGAVVDVHERVGKAAGWSDERSAVLREALRRTDHLEAAAGLADAYGHIDDPVERGETLVALGRCADPEALGRVIREETERYRTPELARFLNTGCVHHVAHELLELADAHAPERASAYGAIADACDFRPTQLRRAAGAAIAERWLALGQKLPAEQASPATHRLAHALACADEQLLDAAVASVPPHVDRWTRAEVAIAEFRRGHSELEELLERAESDEALRRHLDSHYEGSAPWQDAVVEDAARERTQR